MVFADHRVAKFIVVVEHLHDRTGEFLPDRQSEPAGHRPGRVIADRHVDGDDADRAADLLALAERLDIMGLDTMVVQVLENPGRNAAGQDAFPTESSPFDPAIGGGHILVPENDPIFLIGRKDLLFIAVE